MNRIVLIATGLGKINRGFETYIHHLGNLLSTEGLAAEVEVWGRKKPADARYRFFSIPSVFRDSRLAYLLSGSSLGRLNLERFSFFLAMVPFVLLRRPAVLYLGEYRLYGWLYRLRQLFSLRYHLALYTGGQAIPGRQLFHKQRDFIHHITNVYLEECRHFPAGRQQLLPHFIYDNFSYDTAVQNSIRQMAAHRQVVLSVGAIEKSSKRMDVLLRALAPLRQRVFPVLLGEPTADLPEIRQLAENLFGAGNFYIGKVPQSDLGNWYAAADAFVLLSPKESFGLALIEALYHGLPVACYRFQETAFVLQDKAYWLQSNSPKELSAQLHGWLEWIAQEKTTDSATRIEFVKTRYSRQVLHDAYFQMFNQLANT